jgi:hypothetical protein
MLNNPREGANNSSEHINNQTHDNDTVHVDSNNNISSSSEKRTTDLTENELSFLLNAIYYIQTGEFGYAKKMYTYLRNDSGNNAIACISHKYKDAINGLIDDHADFSERAKKISAMVMCVLDALYYGAIMLDDTNTSNVPSFAFSCCNKFMNVNLLPTANATQIKKDINGLEKYLLEKEEERPSDHKSLAGSCQ